MTTKARRFFETFKLALGRLVALIVVAMGALLVYAAYLSWSASGPTVMGGIGLALLVLSAARLCWRAIFLGILETLSGGFLPN